MIMPDPSDTPTPEREANDYFGLPQAMRDNADLRKAYYAGVRIVHAYLHREDSTEQWAANVRADFSAAWDVAQRFEVER